jgi:hypothetical protein
MNGVLDHARTIAEREEMPDPTADSETAGTLAAVCPRPYSEDPIISAVMAGSDRVAIELDDCKSKSQQRFMIDSRNWSEGLAVSWLNGAAVPIATRR